MSIQIDHLYKKYKDHMIFEDISLSLEENRVHLLLGPSGCGKTTLLNILSGLTSMDRGSITGLDGKRFSYIFQEDRLLPWKNARENIEFVLHKDFPKEEAAKIAMDYLTLMNLSEFADYYQDQLSGGMKRRISIARAFAFPSDILLMDEPFKGLDQELKDSLLDSFHRLWLRTPRTVVFVTHDPMEVRYLTEKMQAVSLHPFG